MKNRQTIKRGTVHTTAVGLAALAALAVGLVIPGLVQGAGSSAPATKQKPFSAVYVFSTYVGKEGPYEVWDGTGTGTFVGNSWTESKVHDSDTHKNKGFQTIWTTKGDSLSLYAESAYDATTDSWVGSYWILGGTGPFAGASGSGITVAAATSFSPLVITASLEGWISF